MKILCVFEDIKDRIYERLCKLTFLNKKERKLIGLKKGNLYFQILLVIILIGLLTTPVIGKQYYNYSTYKPFYFDGTESESLKSFDEIKTLNNINWTPEENKFSSDLRILLYPQKDPLVTPERINSTIYSLRGLIQFNSSGVVEPDAITSGKTTISSVDMIYVTITTKPGTSTHILDSYLHSPIVRNEEIFGLYPKYGGNIVDAWVDFSNLKEIANRSEVIDIQTLITGSLSSGSVITEGDEALHSDTIRNIQNGVNGSGIKVGVISDGVEHKNLSIDRGDLPDVVQ